MSWKEQSRGQRGSHMSWKESGKGKRGKGERRLVVSSSVQVGMEFLSENGKRRFRGLLSCAYFGPFESKKK